MRNYKKQTEFARNGFESESERYAQELKQVKKENFPSKTCIVCLRPFVWRKKWAKVWEEVKYCSDSCRSKKASQK